MLVFHWFYKVFLTESPVPRWGRAAAGAFPERCDLGDLLDFPMVFGGYGVYVMNQPEKIF